MNRIKCIRTYFKMSQLEFAKKFHVDQTAVSNWEKEKNNIDIKIMQIISEHFNVPMEFILGKPFELQIPLSEWTEEEREEYEKSPDLAKDFVLYKYGKGIFPTFNEKNDRAYDLGLAENEIIYNRNGKNVIKSFSKEQINLVYAFIDNLLNDGGQTPEN